MPATWFQSYCSYFKVAVIIETKRKEPFSYSRCLGLELTRENGINAIGGFMLTSLFTFMPLSSIPKEHTPVLPCLSSVYWAIKKHNK